MLDIEIIRSNTTAVDNVLRSSGVATPGYKIEFWIDGWLGSSVVCDGTGAWNVVYLLPPNVTGVVFKELNEYGAVISETEPIYFADLNSNGNTPTPTPIIVLLDTVTVKANMSFTLTGSILSTGTATPGYTIAFTLDGIQAGSTQVGTDGTWAYQIPVVSGTNSVIVQELDISNNVISTTNPIPFTEITGYIAPDPDNNTGDSDTGSGNNDNGSNNGGNVSTMVSEIQLITGETNIQLINLLIRKSENFIKMYCKVEAITDDLLDLVQDLAIYKVNSLNRDNVTSEKVGGFSVAYNFTELPPLLQKQLKFVAQKGMISIW